MATDSLTAPGRSGISTSHLAWPGIFAPPIFVIVFIVIGFIKPGYDPIVRYVSEGSIGELGWIQIVDFIVFGLALLAFAVGLWRGFGDRLSGRIGSVLMAIAGAGIVIAGIFVADPGQPTQTSTAHGAVHVAVSLVVFLCLAAAGFTFARRFWNDLWFAAYSIAIGVLIPVAFLTFGLIPKYGGLAQRALIVLVWMWITVLALRLRRAASTVLRPGA